jgi:hypothetical protein
MGFVERLARPLLPIATAIVLADCTDTPAQRYNEPVAGRCPEVLAIFDKYGVQHSQGSGGPAIMSTPASSPTDLAGRALCGPLSFNDALFRPD